jgi:hypothetical protein
VTSRAGVRLGGPQLFVKATFTASYAVKVAFTKRRQSMNQPPFTVLNPTVFC